MTTKPRKTSHPSGGPSSSPSYAGNLASAVTGQNFADKARAFMAINPDKIATVCQRETAERDGGGNAIEPDLKRWGAWLAYFSRIGYSARFMVTCDVWTVPAAWPHQFDGEATIVADTDAGERFVNLAAKRAAKEFDDKQRAAKSPAFRAWPETKRQMAGTDTKPPGPAPLDHTELRSPPRPPSQELVELWLRDAPV